MLLQKYFYAEADPVNKIDPRGLFIGDINEFAAADAINTQLVAEETVSISTTTTLSTGTFPEAVSAVPQVANVARAPISIAGRIAVAVARETITLLSEAMDAIELSPLLGFPIILWGREIPATTLHTFEALIGTSNGFKNGVGIASPFLGRINPGWGRTWLNTVIPLPVPTGQIRDEYPYQITIPGGPFFYDFHQVSVRLVPAFEQRGRNPITNARAQGPKLNTFFIRTGVLENDPLLMWFGVAVTGNNSFFINRNGTPENFPYP
ncbi:MAG: hypothetical protein NVS2B14_16860 [Chamaesiphon sp.]